MKIIENNFDKKEKPVKIHTCRWCKSKFEYYKPDITKSNLSLSQQEEYFNIEGLICPACNRFDNLNNSY